MTHEVTLQGGPMHGAKVEVDDASVLSVIGTDVPDGFCARYRPIDGRKRDCTVYRYVGLSRVLATIPKPGADA